MSNDTQRNDIQHENISYVVLILVCAMCRLLMLSVWCPLGAKVKNAQAYLSSIYIKMYRTASYDLFSALINQKVSQITTNYER